jgi:hypothetical protein
MSHPISVRCFPICAALALHLGGGAEAAAPPPAPMADAATYAHFATPYESLPGLLAFRQSCRIFFYDEQRKPVAVQFPDLETGGHWLITGSFGTLYAADDTATETTVQYYDSGSFKVITGKEGVIYNARGVATGWKTADEENGRWIYNSTSGTFYDDSGKATGLTFFYLEDGSRIFAREFNGDTLYYDGAWKFITSVSAIRIKAQQDAQRQPSRAPTYATTEQASEPTQPSPAVASTSNQASQRIGSTRFSSSNDGTTATTQTIGSTSFYNSTDGASGTSQRIGGTTFHNYRDQSGSTLSGTTQTIGNFGFHNFSNGVTGTSQTIGGLRLDTLSNGKTCTTQKIGTIDFTNCH